MRLRGACVSRLGEWKGLRMNNLEGMGVNARVGHCPIEVAGRRGIMRRLSPLLKFVLC